MNQLFHNIVSRIMLGENGTDYGHLRDGIYKIRRTELYCAMLQFHFTSAELSSNKKYLKGEPGQRRPQQGYEARLQNLRVVNLIRPVGSYVLIKKIQVFKEQPIALA